MDISFDSSKNRTYGFYSGKLDVKCKSFIPRFTVQDFERYMFSPVTVITTDQYECHHLAHKIFEEFKTEDEKKLYPSTK